MIIKYKRIKKQLDSLKRFQDIASAIRFVAGGELGILRKEIKCRFLALSSISPLYNQRYYLHDFSNPIIIPITDDRGSCGSHNNDVILAANDLANFLESKEKAVAIYTIGKKAKNMFKKFFKKNCIGFLLNLKDIVFSIDVASLLLTRLLNVKYDRIYITFNRYFSVNMQRALSYVLGSPRDMIQLIARRSNTMRSNNLFFQSIKKRFYYFRFFAGLFHFSNSLILSDALQDNKYSFLAGRFNGMDNTVKGIGDIIELLQIRYNRARQEHITTELIEIISCKESIMTTGEIVDMPPFAMFDSFEGYDKNIMLYTTYQVNR